MNRVHSDVISTAYYIFICCLQQYNSVESVWSSMHNELCYFNHHVIGVTWPKTFYWLEVIYIFIEFYKF